MKKSRIQYSNGNYNSIICAQTNNCQPKNYTTFSKKKTIYSKTKTDFPNIYNTAAYIM